MTLSTWTFNNAFPTSEARLNSDGARMVLVTSDAGWLVLAPDYHDTPQGGREISGPECDFSVSKPLADAAALKLGHKLPGGRR